MRIRWLKLDWIEVAVWFAYKEKKVESSRIDLNCSFQLDTSREISSPRVEDRIKPTKHSTRNQGRADMDHF